MQQAQCNSLVPRRYHCINQKGSARRETLSVGAERTLPILSAPSRRGGRIVRQRRPGNSALPRECSRGETGQSALRRECYFSREAEQSHTHGVLRRPKNGDPEAGKKPLPELRPGAVVASPPMWKGSPEKRARLEALRRKSLEPEKVAREIAAAQRAAAMSTRRPRRSAPAPAPAPRGSRPPSSDEVPLDWRLLTACKAVADAEEDDRRKAENKRKDAEAARIINAQLKENERAREIERQRREAVKREAQADARRVAAAVRAEKVAAREKKERDRKMFDEQAKAYAAQRARQRAAEEAAERVEVDAAKASLLAEERKNARLKKSFQAEQERLAREIIVARKHKEEQKLAEWRENARIDREAREAQDETERRRAMVKAQRDARIAR